MDDKTHKPGSPETFTLAPAVELDPDGTALEPIRAHFPGDEPPLGPVSYTHLTLPTTPYV